MADIDFIFQSTQPKRAATTLSVEYNKKLKISIHAAQEGCDFDTFFIILFRFLFQSTQPKRAATTKRKHTDQWIKISIHAAQEGCDDHF